MLHLEKLRNLNITLSDPANPSPPGEAALHPYELSFDGATGMAGDSTLVGGRGPAMGAPRSYRPPW